MRWPSRPRPLRRALCLALLAVTALGAAAPPDRLERFRALARARQPGLPLDPDLPADVDHEMYALLDEEIVENLASGRPFASTGFLQDRLDAFSDAWGAAALSVVRVGPLVVGAFQLGEAAGPNSVRVYGRLHGAPALLTTIQSEGRPSVWPLPSAPGGVPQFLLAWDGAASGRGTRALRLDLVRQEGAGVRQVWSTAALFGEPLVARSWALRGAEIRVRYELHYPGWTPGCAGQTEAEDVFRLAPQTGSFARVSRVYHDAWHRELHEVVTRLFDALGAGDTTMLARLVPYDRLRRRLSASLRPEPACDAPEGGPRPRAVSVAASADRVPWGLVFRHADDGWRLARAARVLE